MCNCFKDTLHYSSPAHGDWGVVRVGMLVPESFQLFVCPFACGRHGAIGAMKQGFKNRLAYLYIDQSDIISGYDDLIFDTVSKLIEMLNPTPKVFFVFVSCLDDLIGTDNEAVMEKLSETFEGIEFRACHMNPISLGSKNPPAISIQNNLYSLLYKREQEDNGVNSIGNLVKIDANAEINQFLMHEGFTSLRHISNYETFEDYRVMANSTKNIVFTPTGVKAAETMQINLGTPYIYTPVSYDLEVIEKTYGEIFSFFGVKNYDFSKEKHKAEDAIKNALEKVGDKPIIVDASAVNLPFGLARALHNYGFHVVRIEAQDCMEKDKENMQWVKENCPQIKHFQPQNHEAVKFERTLEDSIAIGVDGGYLAKSRYVLNLFNDEGMFGYYGVVKLMNMLEGVIENPVSLEKIINDYGLVV